MDKLLADIEKLDQLSEKLFGNGITMRQMELAKGPYPFSPGELEDVAVIQAHMDAGAVFEPHFHEATEFIIGVSGEFKLYRKTVLGWRGKKVKPGDIIKIKPNLEHYAISAKESHIVAVLVVIPQKVKEGTWHAGANPRLD